MNLLRPVQKISSRGISIALPKNETIREYKKGSEDRQKLDEALKRLKNTNEIPICIGEKELKSKFAKKQLIPFEHSHTLSNYYHASEEQLKEAIDVSIEARNQWTRIPLEERLRIFEKVADLCAGKYRYDLMAATMLGQGKNIYQAEIDSTCETIDFLRFNIYYALEHSRYQPISLSNIKNSFRLRGCEGFWAAIPPFNFTAIAGNLVSAPAMMGNSVLFKPSDSAILSNYTFYKIMREAGLPAGVVNFVPSDPHVFMKTIVSSPMLAGINFTGSKLVFQDISKTVNNNIKNYRGFPRLTGECGGKNFHLIHTSANLEKAVDYTINSAYQFSGQKCSACSRIFVPESMWSKFSEMMFEKIKTLKVGSPLDDDSFTGPVISETAMKKISSYIDWAKDNSDQVQLLSGGTKDSSNGFFIQNTLYRTKDPLNKLMKDDIFGPIATAFVYPDKEVDGIMKMIDEKSDYALTGAIFAEDEKFIEKTLDTLYDAAGNYYINVQSTGAVVGQQPFGGARLSGTNDKPGGPFYVLKFVSPQSIKRVY